MYRLINMSLSLGLVFLLSSCGTAQKVSKQALEARISKLEEENKALKKEMEVVKAQVTLLLNNLPKPGNDSRPNTGGARPHDWRNEGGAQVATNVTTMEFEKTIHNFGEIKSGESVSYTFKFANTGKNPLVISNAKGSCGCTVPKWPKEPIPPGGEGEIQVTFNSKGKSGNQHKSITLTANTDPSNTRLYIKAAIK